MDNRTGGLAKYRLSGPLGRWSHVSTKRCFPGVRSNRKQLKLKASSPPHFSPPTHFVGLSTTFNLSALLCAKIRLKNYNHLKNLKNYNHNNSRQRDADYDLDNHFDTERARTHTLLEPVITQTASYSGAVIIALLFLIHFRPSAHLRLSRHYAP